jgi:hypothetical protein
MVHLQLPGHQDSRQVQQLRQQQPANTMHATRQQAAAGAAAGLALTGLAAHQIAAQQPSRAISAGNSSAKLGARGGHEIAPGARGAIGTTGTKNVPAPPGYANPRLVSSHRSPEPAYRKGPAGLLSYRSGVHLFPRPGDRQKGVPGIFDPGGYIRTPQRAGTRISRQYAAQQLAAMPNFQRDMTLNGNNIVRNQGAWPWQIPQPSTWWNPFSWNQPPSSQYQFNQFSQLPYNPNGYPYPYGGIQPGYGSQYPGDQYDSYAGINPYGGYPYGVDGNSAYWNGWNNYDEWNDWNNEYANADPFYGGASSGPLSFLSNIFGGGEQTVNANQDPGSIRRAVSERNWLSNLLYFTAYSEGGNTYPANYFAMNGYAPTPYVFNVASGQFWQPGFGYCDYLPNAYQAPITVSLQEVLPSFDNNQNVTGYQPQTFYYDAYWDADAQAYGYYDYRSKFHWVTFPWQQSAANLPLASSN